MPKLCGICGITQTVDNSGIRKINKKGNPVFSAYCRECESDRIISIRLRGMTKEALMAKRKRLLSLIHLIDEQLLNRIVDPSK